MKPISLFSLSLAISVGACSGGTDSSGTAGSASGSASNSGGAPSSGGLSPSTGTGGVGGLPSHDSGGVTASTGGTRGPNDADASNGKDSGRGANGSGGSAGVGGAGVSGADGAASGPCDLDPAKLDRQCASKNDCFVEYYSNCCSTLARGLNVSEKAKFPTNVCGAAPSSTCECCCSFLTADDGSNVEGPFIGPSLSATVDCVSGKCVSHAQP